LLLVLIEAIFELIWKILFLKGFRIDLGVETESFNIPSFHKSFEVVQLNCLSNLELLFILSSISSIRAVLIFFISEV